MENSSSMTCPTGKAWGEKVESHTGMESSNPALVKCKQLPSQKRQKLSIPHILFAELVPSILCALYLLPISELLRCRNLNSSLVYTLMPPPHICYLVLDLEHWPPLSFLPQSLNLSVSEVTLLQKGNNKSMSLALDPSGFELWSYFLELEQEPYYTFNNNKNTILKNETN